MDINDQWTTTCVLSSHLLRYLSCMPFCTIWANMLLSWLHSANEYEQYYTSIKCLFYALWILKDFCLGYIWLSLITAWQWYDKLLHWKYAVCEYRCLLCTTTSAPTNYIYTGAVGTVTILKLVLSLTKLYDCSSTILVFPYQTVWQYSDGDPLNGASNVGEVGKNAILGQYLASLCAGLLLSTVQRPSVIHTAATHCGKLVAFTAASSCLRKRADEVFMTVKKCNFFIQRYQNSKPK